MKSPSSSSSSCCSKVGLKRGPWTAEEDFVLANYIKREGEGRWRMLPKKAGLLRCGKSCRLRWMNYLRPSIKRGHITPDEEDLIIRLHRLLGNRWSLIAGRIPGRTDNEIKNYWNSHLSKKLINQGIDPKTHKPFNPPNSSIDDHNKDSSSSCVPLSYDQNVIMSIKINNTSNYDHDKYIDEDCSKKDLEYSGDLEDGDHEMMDSCHDEAFSSFLDSLINDDIDMFNNQNQD